MGDYGFKIAQAGYDVGTASDQHLVMTSKLNSYKIQTSLQGIGTISIPASSTGTLTVIHNLGYIPAYDGWYSDENGVWHNIFTQTQIGSASTSKLFAFTGFNQNIGTQSAKFAIDNRDSITRIGTIYYIIFVDNIT